MSLMAVLFLALGLGAVAYWTARTRAAAFATVGANISARQAAAVHSRPGQHGWYAALLAIGPALLLIAVWAFAADTVAAERAISALPAAERPADGIERETLLEEVRGLNSGAIEEAFDPNAAIAAQAYSASKRQGNLVVAGIVAVLALLGSLYALRKVRPGFRARPRVERTILAVLIAASLVAILTTVGIVASLLFESALFFGKVSPVEFLTGTSWSPQTALREDQVGSSGAFGAVPLFWGTIFIALIAMVVAVPLGLMAAIYLTQYAAPRARRILKPMLELLAGVPTVVYGYFAALTLAPAVREFAISIGIDSASSESALAAGAVMGVMIIPFVSSMADDAITAVPSAMRDGSLAMGATPSETIRRVLIPAALPGIVGGILLAVSRAIGETMIVVMAAGLAANLTLNPFESVTTVTTQIVQLLTGDQEFDSAKTLSAFALGLVLFVVTFLLNVIALGVVKKYREAYE